MFVKISSKTEDWERGLGNRGPGRIPALFLRPKSENVDTFY